MADDDLELLGAPIGRRGVARLFILGGPIGLAIAIMLGLWVARLNVFDAVIVQAQPQWVASETLPVRVQVVTEFPMTLSAPTVELSVEQDGQRHSLEALTAVAGSAMVQGRIVVPSLTPGPAVLHLHVEAPPFEPRDERIPIEVVEARGAAEGRHVVSTSMSQYADDSDPQPEAWKIDVRPRGRVLAGFENQLWVRVTDAAGQPWSGPLSMRLVDGEFAERRGDADDPPSIYTGRTDAAGLAVVEGLLSSEVVRVLVELHAEGDEASVLAKRKVRLVSFAGAVNVRADVLHAHAGTTVEVDADGLGAKRPVFVDVFDANGAWIDTFDPPMAGHEPARPWLVPEALASAGAGIIQLEAYHFTNAPGESTAVSRVLVDPHATTDKATLTPLLERQRTLLGRPRNDRTWDEERERKYLDALGGAALSASSLESARTWLLGTLPLEVYGPPVLLVSRSRDQENMLAKKRAWAQGIRVFLVVGGGLFLLALTIVMARGHAADANATLAELEGLTEGEEREELEVHVHRARRTALFHGLLIIVIMAGGIACTLVTLEVFVWDF